MFCSKIQRFLQYPTYLCTILIKENTKFDLKIRTKNDD